MKYLKKINNKNKIVNDIGSKILVKVEDLLPNSVTYVDVECDNCKKRYKKLFYNYQKTKKMYGDKIYCVSCIQKVFKRKEEYEEKDRKGLYPEYSEFVVKVLKRDNYICKCCGNHSKDIEVHHLDGYDWCKEKRTDDTNGITLCKNCHSNFHAKYGYGNNTKEQFEEWIGNIKIELKAFNGIITPTRKIYCYEEDKVYDSANDFANKHNLSSANSVYKVCNHEKSCYTLNGKHVFWYDEYIRLTDKEIKYLIGQSSKNNYKSVICLTNNVIYESMTKGARMEGASRTSIDRCCKHQCQYVHTKDGRVTQWMFYDEFLDLNESEDE